LDFGFWILDFQLRIENPKSKINQTFFSFHFPRLKSSAETIARSENAIVIAQKTPSAPNPNL
jgi:hypothetical protein